MTKPFEIEWDTSIPTTNTKHDTGIPYTTFDDEGNIISTGTIFLTAKDWAIKTLEDTKQSISLIKKDKTYATESTRVLKELKQLNMLFKKHIVLSENNLTTKKNDKETRKKMSDFVRYNYIKNHALNSNLINQIDDLIEFKLNNISKKNIKVNSLISQHSKICLVLISNIFKKDGITNHKNLAELLMHINDLEVDAKHL